MTYLVLLVMFFLLYKGYHFLSYLVKKVNDENTHEIEDDKRRVFEETEKLSNYLANIQLKIVLSKEVDSWQRVSLISRSGIPESFSFKTRDLNIQFKCRYSEYLDKYYIQITEDNKIILKSEFSSKALVNNKDTINYIDNLLKNKAKIFNDNNEKIKITKMSPEELELYRTEQEKAARFIFLKKKRYTDSLSDIEESELIDFESHEAEVILKKRVEREAELENKKRQIQENKQKIIDAINESQLSSNVNDYIIDTEDFKRNSQIELDYRRKNKLFLLKTYDNKCAKCGDFENGVDLDHFAIPKSKGGNFVMKTKSGVLVNNAVPLCESCNRSKSNKDYRTFFNDQELVYIFDKNKEMNKRINK